MLATIIARLTIIAHGGAHGRPTGRLVPVPGRPGEWDYTTDDNRSAIAVLSIIGMNGGHHGR